MPSELIGPFQGTQQFSSQGIGINRPRQTAETRHGVSPIARDLADAP